MLGFIIAILSKFSCNTRQLLVESPIPSTAFNQIHLNNKVLLSGFLAIYLTVCPCLVFDHHAYTKSDNHQVIERSYSFDHIHGYDHSNSHEHETPHANEAGKHSHEFEHCCDDLTFFVQSPLREVLEVAIIPSNEVAIPYVHAKLHMALSRDGPIFESARELAATTVIRV